MASLVAQWVKNIPAMWVDLCSIPGLGRSSTGGKNYLLQYSGLENSMDCMVHGVAKGQTGLNNFHFHLASWQEESPREVTCDSS